MIRLLDVPGIPEIENRSTLNDLTGTKIDHDLERKIDTVIREWFGIEGKPDFYFEWAYDEYWTGEDGLTDVEHWRRAGWDITDATGQELKCFPRFEAAMICVAEGYAGHSMIELEAMIWRQAKSEEKALSQSVRAQNQNFLALGRARRKPAA